MTSKTPAAADTLAGHPALKLDWYHTIEIAPGLFTPGRNHKNLALTREILANCEVEGLRCLDIGAMDGLVSVLLTRRGSAHVTAYDRIERTPQIEFVKSCLGVEFAYLKGTPLGTIPDITYPLGYAPFDVVVFSGVLYHMFDPLAGLCIARGLVRNGGLFIIETSAILSTEPDDLVMHFNAAGRFFPGTNYWQISLPCLDYLLRFVRLQPLDLRYFKGQDRAGHAQGRICVVCRATPDAQPAGGDEWMDQMRVWDFNEFLDWSAVQAPHASEVGYTLPAGDRILHPGTRCLDLPRTLRMQAETRVTRIEDQVQLTLDAMQ